MGRDEVIVLDTHAVIWSATEDANLGTATRSLITNELNSDQVAVSTITFWEIAMLAAKGRLQDDVEVAQLRRRFLQGGGTEIAVDGEIAILAGSLDTLHGDPADRLIAATAIVHDATLITADRALLAWRHQLKRQNATK
jgi:PIN domain nuclease of toxin-antitoxin system